jgi:hypothetical protein
MPAPKKEKEIFRLSIDAAWDRAQEAQDKLDGASTAADVAAVAQAWATLAVASKAVLR